MSRSPTLCVVFNNVDEQSSIGSLCAWSVRTALAAGWQVSVVARDLDPELRTDVEWLPLYVPPRLHAVQWYAALATVKRAMGDRRWDVVHTSQPQLMSLADILQLHYIVRAARESAPVAKGAPIRSRDGLKRRVGRAQVRLTEVGENWHLARLPDRLELVPVSGMVRDEFERLYGRHERTTVLDNPGPEPVTLTLAERQLARDHLVGARTGTVVGFLGGNDPRKGGEALLQALASTDAIALLGGHGSEELAARYASERVIGLGFVEDKHAFYAACDVFAAVSTFEPGPLTALEAAAHGVPVVGTRGCGVVRDQADAGCAVLWSVDDPLRPALDEALGRAPEPARAFAASRSRAAQTEMLLGIYQRCRDDTKPGALSVNDGSGAVER